MAINAAQQAIDAASLKSADIDLILFPAQLRNIYHLRIHCLFTKLSKVKMIRFAMT